MFPLIFVSLCAQNFLCATFYQHLSIFITPCMKYVQTHFLKKDLCALQVFLCALISRPVYTRTCAQLRGNIDYHHSARYSFFRPKTRSASFSGAGLKVLNFLTVSFQFCSVGFIPN